MRRSTLALAAALALSACGGGGGTATLPAAPVNAKPAAVSFVLNVPVKSKQVRGYVRRADGTMYVSPATLGVGINFATGAGSTFTSSQIATPNVVFDLSSCSTNCTANSDGSQTYTITAPVAPGTYSFEVTTWDAPPSSGSFSGVMLSQAYVANQTIVAGSTSTTLPLTLNAVPASVNFIPLPAQSHVVQVTGGYSIIGNAPVQFVANALDSHGYVITGSGAPAFSATDPTGSFTFSESGSTNIYNVRAIDANATNTSVSIGLNATPPSGSNLSAATASINLTPTPELWFSVSGGSANQVTGYALGGASPPSSTAIDYVASSFPNGALAADDAGDLWVMNKSQIQELSASVGTTSPTMNAQFIQMASPQSLATDANGLLWIADNNMPSGYNEVVAYNVASLSSGPVYSISSQPPGPSTLLRSRRPFAGAPTSISDLAIAPSSPAIPSALTNSVWVSTNYGIDVLTVSGGVLQDAYPGVSSTPTTAIAIGTDGTVWTYDGTNLNAYNLSFTTQPVLSAEASTAVSGALNQMVVDPSGGVWLTNSTNGDAEQYVLSGCPASCAVSYKANLYAGSFTAAGVFVTP